MCLAGSAQKYKDAALSEFSDHLHKISAFIRKFGWRYAARTYELNRNSGQTITVFHDSD